MDPRQLPPMRSGIGGVVVENDESLHDTRKRLIATVTVMTRKAGEYAAIWAHHANRKDVTAADVNVALKHQAKHFLFTIDQPDVIQEIEDMERYIFESIEDDTDSETEDSATSSDTVKDIPEYERVERDGHCACTLCVEMRAAEASWDSWNPEDEAEQYLKNSVNMAIESAHQKISSVDDT